MKRTVKAWAAMNSKGDLSPDDVARYKSNFAFLSPGFVIVPCTITYDDGKNPKRKGKK
jgi:hypothetical protein